MHLQHIISNQEINLSKQSSDSMNFNGHINKFLLIIPAITVFFIALIPTLKYGWPLSWDIIYHVLYAKIYSQYGFVLTNPLITLTGQKIGYPPLFHFLIAALGNTLKIDYFQVARFLQPILAFFIVLSVSYVAKEFYGKIAGISAGFLIISSYLVFRIMLPVPENLALIFIPLAIYLYYLSIKKNILKYALISGILFLPVIASHQAAVLCLVLVIGAFTLLELVMHRNINVFKNLGAFFLFLIILIALGLILLLIWKPDLLFSLLNQGLSASAGFSTSLNYSQPLSHYKYIQYLGPLVLISALIGGIFAVKKRHKKHYFIIIWIISLFLLSKAYWFGINVLSARVLIYMLIPLAIFGGFGISQLYCHLKKYRKFSSPQIRSTFLVCIFILSVVSGVITVSGPVFSFQAKTSLGNIQIAPPSTSEVDVANWFNENGDKTKSLITSNLYTGTLITSVSEVPIHYGFEYFNKNTPLSIYKDEKIGYIVIDKRLTFPSKNGTLYMQSASSEYYPLFFFSEDIHNNIKEIIPDYAKVVYENDDFIVCQIPY